MNHRNLITVCLLSGVLLFAGCAAQTNLTPVDEGDFVPNISAGGPMFEMSGSYIPLPYATVGGTYGYTDRINFDGNIHLVALAYEIAGAEAGASWFPDLPESSWIPRVHGRLLALTSFKGGVDNRIRVYPMVGFSAAHPMDTKLFYCGMDIALPLTDPDYDSDAAKSILSPYVGIRWPVGKYTSLSTELKWQGMNIETSHDAVKYANLFNHGAITPLLSLQWTPALGGQK